MLCRACGKALQAKIKGQYVPDAPYQVGDRVLVARTCDETSNPAYLGQEGIVVELGYTGGVSESFPSDPLMTLQFAQGRGECWGEEVDLIDAADYTTAPLYDEFEAARQRGRRP